VRTRGRIEIKDAIAKIIGVVRCSAARANGVRRFKRPISSHRSALSRYPLGYRESDFPHRHFFALQPLIIGAKTTAPARLQELLQINGRLTAERDALLAAAGTLDESRSKVAELQAVAQAAECARDEAAQRLAAILRESEAAQRKLTPGWPASPASVVTMPVVTSAVVGVLMA